MKKIVFIAFLLSFVTFFASANSLSFKEKPINNYTKYQSVEHFSCVADLNLITSIAFIQKVNSHGVGLNKKYKYPELVSNSGISKNDINKYLILKVNSHGVGLNKNFKYQELVSNSSISKNDINKYLNLKVIKFDYNYGKYCKNFYLKTGISNSIHVSIIYS